MALTRRGKVVASVLSGALVVGGCGGAALALTSGPGPLLTDWGPAGDGLGRYLLTMEPGADASLLADAALASAVVPLSAALSGVATAAATPQPPAGAEALGPGGRIVQIAGTAYYVTDLGGVAVTPGASTAVLSPVDLAQWASQNGVHLDLPASSSPSSRPGSSPVPSASASPPSGAAAAAASGAPASDEQLADLAAAPGVVSAQRVIDLVLVAGDLTLAQARALPGVVAAQPSLQGELFGELALDDPWALQWGYHLENTGNSYQPPIASGADIDAADGWAASEGAGAVIAVIDSGFDVNHPDMQGALWTNPDPACATADTDRDGIVGDCHGWNFYKNSADLLNDDTGSHGVAVSGIAAARKGNGIGSAGVAPRATIMPLVAGYGRSVDMSAAVRAIYYAADHGATVINASWGTNGDDAFTRRMLTDAIRYAGSKGVLVVAAAGNDSRDRDQVVSLPASIDDPNLITVGSSNSADTMSPFTAWGARSVDLFAPGSWVPVTRSGGYDWINGTSFSSPIVASAVALYRTARPDLTSQQVKEQLLADATRLPAFAGKSVTGGRLDLANLGASAGGAQYAFSGMNGTAGALAPQVGVTATTGAGDYALSLGLAMQVDGEPWAVAGAPVTLGGQAATTDDDGFVTFPLGVLSDFGTRTFAPGLSLGDGTYALVAQLLEDGTPVGRPFAAPLLVGPAAEQAPGGSTPGGGSDPGPGGGPNPSGPDPGSSDPGGGSGPGSGDRPVDGSGPGGGSNPGGGDQPGTSVPDDRGGSGDGSAPGGSSNPGGGSNPGVGVAPGGTSPVDRDGSGGTGGGSNPGPGAPAPEPTRSTGPEAPSGDPTPTAPGGGGGGSNPGGGSPAPSSTPSPSGTRSYDSAGDFDITSLTPTVVGTAGGTTVRASGRGFSYRVSVRVGDAAAQVVSAQDGELTFVVPARSAGTYDLVVFAPGRESKLPGAITYRDSDSGAGSNPGGGGGSDPGTSNPGTSNPGGGGGSDPGTSNPGGSSSPAATARTGPNGERLTKSAKLSGVGYVWSTQCRTTCSGTRL